MTAWSRLPRWVLLLGGAVDMLLLSPFFGVIVGFSLGLTGGGGAIFAVPLLVYGLAVPAREAVGISLAAVGAIALVGAIQRLRAGEVQIQTGVLFALAGMLGAPMGTWLNRSIPEPVLLALFAGFMAFVALRMWQRASQARRATPPHHGPHAASRGTLAESLTLRSRETGLLGLVGLLTGVLSGLFGVGGGFVIVPALVLIRGMAIHRAVATSLVVIPLVSASGVLAYLAAGQPLALPLASLFVLGGVGGMRLGTHLSRTLSGPRLQQGFAVALLAVAALIITKNVF